MTSTTPSEDLVRDERFRLGIEGSGLGTWDLDLSTKELIWSATTRRLFGISTGNCARRRIARILSTTAASQYPLACESLDANAMPIATASPWR